MTSKDKQVQNIPAPAISFSEWFGSSGSADALVISIMALSIGIMTLCIEVAQWIKWLSK